MWFYTCTAMMLYGKNMLHHTNIKSYRKIYILIGNACWYTCDFTTNATQKQFGFEDLKSLLFRQTKDIKKAGKQNEVHGKIVIRKSSA